jgi:putative tricarboxylic transport membrane protein
LLISQGSPFIFFTRPISAVFMALAILSIGWGIWVQMRSKTLAVGVEDEEY